MQNGPTNLQIIGAISGHILEQAIKDPLNLPQECRAVSVVLVGVNLILVDLMTGCPGKRVERI